MVKPWDCETLMEDRPIFKIKIKEFQEGEGSAPPSGDPSMRSYLLSQVNEHRLAAASSKVGHLTDVESWDERLGCCARTCQMTVSPRIIDLVIEDIRDDVGAMDLRSS